MSDLIEKTEANHADHNGVESANSQITEESQATAKLLRKCDIRLLPPLMVVYFLSFMDRTNIGT